MARRKREECDECGEEDLLTDGLCEDCIYEKKMAEKRKACKKKGYHNWEIYGVRATLPHQELQLCCSDCEVEAEVYFDHYDD